MNLSYVTTYDASDVQSWSGIGFYMAQSLQSETVNIELVGALEEKKSYPLKLKQCIYQRLTQKKYLLERDPAILKHYATQVSQKLKRSRSDIIFSPGTLPIAHLKHEKPIVFWTDATFGGMLNFYPEFSHLCQKTQQHGNQMEQQALDNCQLAIYSSEWAAQSAIDLYGAEPSKVKVVPFGANLECDRTLDDIERALTLKPTNICKLLFIGVHWERKGGQVALEVARALNQAGLKTELTVVGCQPVEPEALPDFVNVIEFISKHTPAGRQQINQLFSESHFLILPSVADCTPIVFSEANSFGLPCLSTNVGGITTIIQDHVNGKTFSKTAPIEDYCTYLSDLFLNYAAYRELSLSSFHQYQSRLNWRVAGQAVTKLMNELL
jgi:glycosyltransferase involved in cell wall biosynthesis